MTRAIILDGPPASGKTTIVHCLSKELRCFTCTYKALGFANLLSSFLLCLNPRLLHVSSYEVSREDPMILLYERFSTRLDLLFSFSEILYKLIQVLTALSISFFGIVIGVSAIIVDEGIAIRWANYDNAVKKGLLHPVAVGILMRLDVWFVHVISRIETFYCFNFPDISRLEEFWKQRGHRSRYPVDFSTQVFRYWQKFRQTPIMQNGKNNFTLRQFDNPVVSLKELSEFLRQKEHRLL